MDFHTFSLMGFESTFCGEVSNVSKIMYTSQMITVLRDAGVAYNTVEMRAKYLDEFLKDLYHALSTFPNGEAKTRIREEIDNVLNNIGKNNEIKVYDNDKFTTPSEYYGLTVKSDNIVLMALNVAYLNQQISALSEFTFLNVMREINQFIETMVILDNEKMPQLPPSPPVFSDLNIQDVYNGDLTQDEDDSSMHGIRNFLSMHNQYPKSGGTTNPVTVSRIPDKPRGSLPPAKAPSARKLDNIMADSSKPPASGGRN